MEYDRNVTILKSGAFEIRQAGILEDYTLYEHEYILGRYGSYETALRKLVRVQEERIELLEGK